MLIREYYESLYHLPKQKRIILIVDAIRRQRRKCKVQSYSPTFELWFNKLIAVMDQLGAAEYSYETIRKAAHNPLLTYYSDGY